ncbi:SRPBCC family protein [Antarcticibacterium flavum]|uniref:SRPBCC family protein n=1 Tax=Antarcticibacterium flavum TaxID=2058175 RepID=A0A5B7WZK5_9FLAO|nr:MULTISPECIES: SRPBCC family protein [Antarcticibacterium]MCM4161754.1 cell division protein [Antarcticibacterium sp. W02-3]QCY68415.1 SRPBCC family protein [Antarcticibacterium flavum]
MPVIKLDTHIKANRYIVFDLARSIDLQSKYVTSSNEKAVAGRTSGLINLGETVTYRGKHLGVRQHLTSKITEIDRPHLFVDEMQKGAFKSLRHEHHFIAAKDGTLMKDVFIFEAPLGVLGKIASQLVLKSYMTNFLKNRNKVIKDFAESGRWKEVLPEDEELYYD